MFFLLMQFKKLLIFSILISLLHLSLNTASSNQAIRLAGWQADKIEDEILNTAESFFIALKEKRFSNVWEGLTIKSRETIIDEVYREINRKEARVGREVIREEFYSNGELSKTYWETFLRNFDPDIILQQSVWDIGKIKTETAIIVLQYKKSEYPAELRLYKEDGRWRVGLVETFWTRKGKM
ncbi:MAG: hypothetical protein HY756_07300 [Nitrospirae bacterium]|nr:hypothetical protein [Nitrospirota bacterium]